MDNIINGLWIGDIQDVREQSTERFDRVITVCQDEVSDNVGCDYQHFNMSEGETDSYGGSSNFVLFRDATEAVVDALENDETVLVHCHVGRSRSASVCIAAIGRHYDMSYGDAYNTVSDTRYIQPDPTLVQHAKTFIGH